MADFATTLCLGGAVFLEGVLLLATVFLEGLLLTETFAFEVFFDESF